MFFLLKGIEPHYDEEYISLAKVQKVVRFVNLDLKIGLMLALHTFTCLTCT